MSSVSNHIQRGLIVGPVSKRALRPSPDGAWLEDAEAVERYRVISGGVPVLLADEAWASSYAADSTQMQQEYSPSRAKRWRDRFIVRPHANPAARRAFFSLFEGLSADAVCLSPGGGPSREHPQLTTLNIGPFPNVDVVADAHELPYGNETVDAIYSEAVFEHLYAPAKAAAEMFRVLKPGCKAYVATPFLQPYHGYPHHYQNYTITGHARLFETAGFEVIKSGTDVGPTFALITMIGLYLRDYAPGPIGKVLRGLWALLAIALNPLDRWIVSRPNAYLLASSTYVLLRKRS